MRLSSCWVEYEYTFCIVHTPLHDKRCAGLSHPSFLLSVGDQLVKIVRIRNREASQATSVTTEQLSNDFTKEVLSGVLFAPLLRRPSQPVVLKSRVWSTDVHQSYPESFRRSCKELLLCSVAPTIQPVVVPPSTPINAASLLPKPIWLEILSYTHRDWFESDSLSSSSNEALCRRVRTLETALDQSQKEHNNTKLELRQAQRQLERFGRIAMQLQRRRWRVDPSTPSSELEAFAELLDRFGGDDEDSDQQEDDDTEGNDEEESDDDGMDESLPGFEDDEDADETMDMASWDGLVSFQNLSRRVSIANEDE